MMRPIFFATVLAAMSLPVAAASAEGTETKQPSREQPSQGHAPQTSTPQPGAQIGAKGAAVPKEDRDFINKAGLGGLYQVRAGQLAVQKAQSSDVKQLAQRMVDDHTAVDGRLQKFAQQKGLSLPTQLDKKHQDKIDSLAKKTGADFDKAYVDEMVDDHKGDIDDFEKAAKDAKEADVKEFAATVLPTLREHLQAAHALKDKLK